MARQIQLRRGTAAQHENFTGADGEVTVDTTNHTLRVHDGQTVGGTALMRADAMDAADYVVAFQAPTAANGYTWYRKYKSGWVEQGGTRQITITNDSGASIVQLPIPMQNTNYFAVVQGGLVQGQSYLMYNIEKHSNSAINLVVSAKTSVTSASIITAWEVKGVAA